MSFDPAIFQAALLEVAEATKAAASAAQAIQSAPQPAVVASPGSSPSSSNAQNVDWSKLLNKPPLFDYKSSEDEIRAYRDWNWQLVQFLNAIDSGYGKELQSLMDDPSHPFDLESASSETRNRSAKLYGLLASLCRNRSLHVIRSVKNGDGYEALRQLTLALRPSSSGRGLALMSALTSWPQFAMNQQLQPQVLRLEDALEEARKAGATIPDQLKQAILLKSVSGQLRTHLNLSIQETTTFAELRDHVLRWDRSQQRWNGLLFSEDVASSTAAPMEVDRIYSSGKKGGKDKGKGWQQKGQQKGKGKSKTKSKGDGKSNNKGKQKGDGKSKSGGKSNDSTGYKGKGNSTSGVCHRCGKPGHYARDCWASNVRAVQSEGQQQPQTLIHGSGIQVPIELQHHSMSVRGWVRVLREEPQQFEPLSVRVVKADVIEDLAGMRVGWELDSQGVGRGKHFANCFQDPTVVCPSMAGSKFRTTLVRDGGQWLVMELCEPMETLIDLSSEFHGFNGSNRYVLTIITDNDCPPETMGFRLIMKVRNL